MNNLRILIAYSEGGLALLFQKKNVCRNVPSVKCAIVRLHFKNKC